MVRFVVNNKQVPHLWAHQSQAQAKGNGSISFNGKYLYSYSALIGNLVTAPNGETVALLTSRRWSVTTSGHQSAARGAVSHLTSFEVGSLGEYGQAIDHVKNMAQLTESYRTELAAGFRKRTIADWNYSHLRELATAAEHYARVFNLDAPDIQPTVDHARLEAYHNTPDKIAKRALRETREAETRAQREAEELKARAARQIAIAAAVAKWRTGVQYDLPYAARSDDNGGALIRINGDVLETSKGASVPLNHAIKVFRRVAACKAAGQSWQRNGDTIRVGSFEVDAIEPDGSFRAGCHKFNWSEIERAAKEIGLV